MLVKLAAQPGSNGQLSCLHSFKVFWTMKSSYVQKFHNQLNSQSSFMHSISWGIPGIFLGEMSDVNYFPAKWMNYHTTLAWPQWQSFEAKGLCCLYNSIISQAIIHVTCYKFLCSDWLKLQTEENVSTNVSIGMYNRTRGL